MPSPTDIPPACLAPLFAASMIPGPPPVITAKPSSASAAPISSACWYSFEPRLARALPNTVTARGKPARAPKPSTNSAWMRSTRWSVVLLFSSR